MPFTMGGDWIPDAPPKAKQPIKIFKEKRRASYVTIIANLPHARTELKSLCSTLQQRLGCGGAIKEGRIELQGDQVESVKAYLKNIPFLPREIV
jgi:translation initiation factor 1